MNGRQPGESAGGFLMKTAGRMVTTATTSSLELSRRWSLVRALFGRRGESGEDIERLTRITGASIRCSPGSMVNTHSLNSAATRSIHHLGKQMNVPSGCQYCRAHDMRISIHICTIIFCSTEYQCFVMCFLPPSHRTLFIF